MAGDEHFAPALVLNWMTPALLFCLIYFKGLINLIIFITLLSLDFLGESQKHTNKEEGETDGRNSDDMVCYYDPHG